ETEKLKWNPWLLAEVCAPLMRLLLGFLVLFSFFFHIARKLLGISTTATTFQGNLCRGGQMIDNMDLEPNDKVYYKANLKIFPDGLYYPNCSLLLQPNTTKEELVGECVNFTIASNKLNLSKGKDLSNTKERVMWVLIHHLCANESCGQPSRLPILLLILHLNF
uniref:Prion/Doppel protein beta-ribbon domain-containing protein n=1 Tax=Anolis carolinensis TaxID=28377 RepID=A0A803T0P7_ANOCA